MALEATLWRRSGESLRVIPMKTGKVPIGSMTTIQKMARENQS
jgi:hypothetical protein